MNLIWLEAFKQVADSGSYTRAAEALFISQPAVSQQVRHLEGFFGARLIDRRGQQLVLTEAGNQVYELAARLLGDVNATRQNILAQAEGFSGLITIVSTPSPLMHTLPRGLGRFWARNGGVEVKTIVRFGNAIAAAVKDGHADLGLHSGAYIDESLERTRLADSRIICVANPSHPFAGRDVSLEDVVRQRVSIVSKPTETRSLIDAWFQQRGVALGDILEVSSHEETRIAARQGLAVGILSEYVAVEDIRAGRLAVFRLEGFDITHPNFVCYRPGPRGPVRFLIDALIESAAAGDDE